MQSNNLNDSLIPQITEEDANRIIALLKDNLSEITSNPTQAPDLPMVRSTSPIALTVSKPQTI